jgi:hypothetical protein
MILIVGACSSSPPKQVAPPPNPTGSAETSPSNVGPSTSRPVDARPPPPPDAPPDAPQCPVVNPKGCPATEPNVNRPCAPKNIECIYDTNCCHSITYVCAKNLHFEAHVQRCP